VRLLANGEQRLEVVLGEGLEGDERLGARDPLDLADAGGDDVGELLVALEVQDRHEVPHAGDGVDLADAVDLGQPAAERRHRAALGLDQDDRVGHSACVSPGASTTTSADVSRSTSALNACASVSIGGNVL
jgi:hypothetical protein